MPLDASLLDLFRAEIESHLPVLGEGLLELEKDPTQTQKLEAMMRAAHSVKGAARIVGVEAAVQVAHVMEDCFVAAQGGQISFHADAVDVLLRGVDVLTRIAESVGPDYEGWVAANDALLQGITQQLQTVRSGKAPARSAPPRPPAAEVPEGVIVPARLDAAGVEILRTVLQALLDKDCSHISLDFGAVQEVTTAGLVLLATLPVLAGRRPAPVRLEIGELAPELGLVFTSTRLDQVYHLRFAGGA